MTLLQEETQVLLLEEALILLLEEALVLILEEALVLEALTVSQYERAAEDTFGLETGTTE